MGHFLPRETVNERLRLTMSATSYRIVPSTGYGNRINSDRVVEFLNAVRRGDVPVARELPSDLLTPEELVSLPELADSDITTREILTWARRTRDPIPHYRINSHTRRYPRGAALAWMERKFA